MRLWANYFVYQLHHRHVYAIVCSNKYPSWYRHSSHTSSSGDSLGRRDTGRMPTKTSPTVIIRVSSLRNEPKYYDAKFVVSLLPQATTKQVLVYYAMQYIGVNSWDVSMPSTIMSHILYILDFEYLIRITYTLHIQTYHPLVHAWLHANIHQWDVCLVK